MVYKGKFYFYAMAKILGKITDSSNNIRCLEPELTRGRLGYAITNMNAPLEGMQVRG